MAASVDPDAAILVGTDLCGGLSGVLCTDGVKFAAQIDCG